MNPRLFLAPFLFVAAASFAANAPAPPSIPEEPIAKKKELLFSDDFARTSPEPGMGKGWTQVVPTFTVDGGVMKGTQTRVDTPAADGKPAIVGHQAVVGNDISTKDSIIEFRFKFEGATGVSAEYDDRKYTGSHYGHICMARVTPKSVILSDQRDGGMSTAAQEMAKDPARKAERAEFLKGKSATFPVDVDVTQWHTFMLETVGDEMRVTLDGKAVGYLKSSGIAHPTKSKVEFGCQGKDGLFADVKIWNAEPAK